MHSHHSHSGQFCKHAVGTLEEVIQTAIGKGFTIFGLSEHVPKYRLEDRYPEEEEFSLAWFASTFDDYVEEAHRLRTKYAPQITLLVGLETDYVTTLDLEKLQEKLSRYGDSIEYIVGSVHHIDEIPIDYGQELFDKAAAQVAAEGIYPTTSKQTPVLEPLISRYLDSQLEVMERFHPEVIGHFDLFRLYYPKYSLGETETPEVWGTIKRNVQFAVGYGALFELNAAAFRKGWDQAYPGKELAELILSLGGRFTLSDDSHGPHAVGLNYSRLHTYAKDVLGLKDIWHLERCEEKNAGGRKVKAVKWEGSGEWHSQSFWSG
ncbi:histidinol-phosphatase, partial [Clavulina sp. PMI_390]